MIFGTFLVVSIYAYRKNGGGIQPESTDEITTGYGKMHRGLDKYVLSRFRGNKKTGDEGGIEELTEKNETKKESVKNKQDEIAMIHEKIDANNRELTKQFTGMFTNLTEKIDKITKE